MPIKDGTSDNDLWNRILAEEGEEACWFDSAWLLTECYAYRRVMEAVQLRCRETCTMYFIMIIDCFIVLS